MSNINRNPWSYNIKLTITMYITTGSIFTSHSVAKKCSMDSSIVLWRRNSSCDSNETIRSAVLEIASAIKFADIANDLFFL